MHAISGDLGMSASEVRCVQDPAQDTAAAGAYDGLVAAMSRSVGKLRRGAAK